MQRRVTVWTILAALLFTLAPAAPAAAVDDRSAERIRTIVENRINNARESRGLRPLRINMRLEYFAQTHAQNMAEAQTLFHDTLNRLQLESPATALSWAENIGRNTSDNAGARAHYLFMHSDGHRANILNATTTHMGIGVQKRGAYTYIVERFARLP
jgi:uncharacterized protein YkwD